MTSSQLITLAVLAAVIVALIWDRLRSDVVALTGAAILLVTRVVRPIEVQGAFASPAIMALASLFVITYAMELSGLLDAAIRHLTALCRRIGKTGRLDDDALEIGNLAAHAFQVEVAQRHF